jgi:hypothetical protein
MEAHKPRGPLQTCGQFSDMSVNVFDARMTSRLIAGDLLLLKRL